MNFLRITSFFIAGFYLNAVYVYELEKISFGKSVNSDTFLFWCK